MTTASPARTPKFSPPAIGRILPRPHLEALIDAARCCPIAWISAPLGAGKTTLLASALAVGRGPLAWYRLDSDDAVGEGFPTRLGQAVSAATGRGRSDRLVAEAPATTRQALRAALRHLPAGAALVLDDLDESVMPAMEALLPLMADEVPAGATIFVATHLAAPQSLARHCANQQMAVIPADALRLDAEETAELLALATPTSGLDPLDAHRATEGWLAGTLLLAREPRPAGAGQPIPSIVDYFNRHVFERLDAESRQLLLHVAALPDFDAPSAAALSQTTGARRLLDDLVGRQCFIERRGDGRFAIHPMFRAFLARERDSTLPAPRRRALLDHAGRLAEAAGLAADAADHFAAAASWNSLLRVMHTAVPALLASGQHDRVDGWLRVLPEHFAREDGWTMLWHGLLTREANPRAASGRFEAAWTVFSSLGDAIGQAATLDAALTAYVCPEADLRGAEPWVKRVEKFARNSGADLPARAEAHVAACGAALVQWRLAHPLLPRWVSRIRTLACSIDDQDLVSRLVAFGANYHFWRGEVVRAAALLECPELPLPAGVRRVGAHLVRRLLQSEGDGDACHSREPADPALAHCGLDALLDFVRPCAPTNQVGGDPPRPDATIGLRDRVRACVRHGRLAEAIALQEMHVEEMRARARPLGLALALLDAGALSALGQQPERGRRHLDEACALAEQLDSDLLRWNAGLWRAGCAEALHDPAVGAMVAAAVHVGARHGYLACHPWWDAAMMTRLMRHALEHPVEREYVARLIRACNLIPDSPETEDWPWPVRVHTLGRFSVVIDGHPLVFHGKAQRRPMDLLKAVIAFGGRDIGISTLIEALWPDAEGDAGRRSFDVALLRLRRLIGRDDALLLGEGKLSLNDKVCWVDVWSLWRLLGNANANEGADGAVRHARRLSRRCGGPFLQLEETQAWMLPLRERVQARTLRVALVTADALEGYGLWAEAADLYTALIDVSTMNEELHRRVARCHHHLGQPSEARVELDRHRRPTAPMADQPPTGELRVGRLALKGA